MPVAPHRRVVSIDDRRLAVARWGSEPVEVVMLHDGLGSITQWRDVPARIAAATGVGVVAYDRSGHGTSTPVPDGAWPTDWLHREAAVLPQLLDELEIVAPLLVGHSDGGSIALLHAAAVGSAHPRCAGVVAFAAHAWVEPVCVDAIRAMRSSPAPVISGLAKHHAAPTELFRAWSGVWTSDAFRSWDVRAALGAIDCPVVAVQGADDEYATDAQLTGITQAIGTSARMQRLPGVGHVVHHAAPDTVVEIVRDAHRHMVAGGSGPPRPSTTNVG